MASLRFASTAAACALALACPAVAAAVPPENDNYLSSTIVADSSGTLPKEFTNAVDTSEATTQADLFNPQQDGSAGSGGGAEPLQCGATPFAKTVWYDVKPPTWGGVEIFASGFDTTVGVYEWSPATGRITRTVACQNDETSAKEDVILDVRKGTNYTVQVGGANGAAGPLEFELNYYPDRDHDGEFDELDDCPSVPGTRGGCPPELRAAPRFAYSQTNPLVFTKLAVDSVPKGGKVEVSCRHCGRKITRKARRTGTVRLTKFLGRRVPAGDAVVIRVTKAATGRGKFRFGATGKYIKYPVLSTGLGRRVIRCLQPGSRKPTRCK
jgi:hypothetical protein